LGRHKEQYILLKKKVSMYTLANTDLTVSVLDPLADAAREGSRYCTGGYIWQVTDAHQGELLTGPEYPQEPNTFDGQGMPDMFQRALGAEGVPVGGEVGCIGVGRVRCTSPIEPFDVRHNREVIEFVHWDIDCAPDSLTMRTEHNFRDWAYRLARIVSLHGRAVHSRTEIHNTGQVPLPVRWFAHPFFPIPEDGVLCRFSIPVSLAENPGYFLNPEGFVTRKTEHNWKRGWYQPVEYQMIGSALTTVEKHPKTGQVTVVADYLPTFLPIWGNDRTFSFEPYFEKELAAGEGAAWSLEYRF
jgi:hypothetical protein